MEVGDPLVKTNLYRKHMMLVHGELLETSATCDKCGKHFTNLQCFQDHMKQSHPTANELAKGGLISESFSIWLKSPKKCSKN